MNAVWKQLHYSARVLIRNPVFSVVCILTLALGIGVNTAVFSIANFLFLRPLAVKDPQQLTVLAFPRKDGSLMDNFSIAAMRDIRSGSLGVFSELIGYQLGMDGLSIGTRADRLVVAYVTGNFFSGLGLQPAVGQLIQPGQGELPGADPVLVLGYNYWQRRFAGDPHVVGRKVWVDGHPFTVLGVAPKGFHGLYAIAEMQAFIPLGMAAIEGYPRDFMENRGIRNVYLYGRLRDSVSLQRAQAALAILSRRIAQQYPQQEKGLQIELFAERLARPDPDPHKTILVVGVLFLALSALVLLIAGVNVTNILLVRATVRQREMAIRVALGASCSRLVQQVLSESVLLGLAGGAAGLLLGYLGSTSLGSLSVGTDLPVLLDFGFDWRVFSYAFTGAILVGVLVGLVPALGAAKMDLNQTLQTNRRGSISGRNRLRNLLVTAQVAGSLMLLIVAGLFSRSLAMVQHVQLGFDPNNLVNLSMDPNEIGYSEAQGKTLFRAILRRVGEMPGVQSASFANCFPMGYYNNADRILVPDRQTLKDQSADSVLYNVVSPAYFQTMGIRLLRGRVFTDADDEQAPRAAIISETMAARFWREQDPIGREFRMNSDRQHSLRIVGIVNDIRFSDITGPIDPFFYIPLWQNYAANSLVTLQVRTPRSGETAIPEIEGLIHSLAPDLPVFDTKTMTESLYTLNGLLKFQIGAAIAGVLGLIGLVLAVVGVYGVISYVAMQRTHEIGLRMALGARPANILELVFRYGLLTIGLGLVIGLPITIAAATIVGQFVIVSPTDALTYIGVTGLLTAVALSACYIPARRAMRVDPMQALRYD
jgi:putative ABC transport system permease protein